MIFIDFPFQEDANGKPIIPDTSILLRQRRTELGLTQQQVARAAHITTQQYQRLESGARKLENASFMKVALPICLILRIRPSSLLPDAEELNAFIDTIAQKSSMSAEEILKIAEDVFSRYNDYFGTHYSSENVKIEFCTVDNARAVYKSFTSEYGFYYERRPSFSGFGVEAFIGPTDCDDPEHVDGILIRTDVPSDIDNARSYMKLFVREIAQIFCTTHEIPTAGKEGQRFFDLYCAGAPMNLEERTADGQMNAGYAIWRQLIPDIIADEIYPEPPLYLKEIKTYIDKRAQEVKVGISTAKEAMCMILARVMNSYEAKGAESWEELEEGLQEAEIPFNGIIHLVYDQLNTECPYRITPEFIQDLGTAFMVAQIKNTSQEDIMAFMGRFGR